MTTEPEVLVRAAVADGLGALTELYDHCVTETAATFDTVPLTPEERRPRLLSHREDDTRLLMVAWRAGPDGAPGRIPGYASRGPFRTRPAYAHSTEVSVSLAPAATGRGIGGMLYGRLLAEARASGPHRAYAAVTQPDEASGTAAHPARLPAGRHAARGGPEVRPLVGHHPVREAPGRLSRGALIRTARGARTTAGRARRGAPR